MWEYFEPQDNQWYRWDLNGASALLHKSGDEWQVLFNQIKFLELQDTFGGPVPAEAPQADSGISFAVGRGKKVGLRPYLSGRPYLVTVQDDIRILPGAETRFDVVLPPLLRFELFSREEPLGEKMPFILSDSWFGDTMSGVLCHSLPSLLIPRCNGNTFCSRDARGFILGTNTDSMAMVCCELLVRNTSRVVMDLKRVAIYTDMLNVYEKDGKLLTEDVTIDSLSDGSLKMSINHGQKKGYRKLTSSLNGGISEVLVRRGVEFLKSVTSI